MTETTNNREFVRVPDSLDIVYEIEASGKKKKTATKNISEQGICFFSEEKFDLDSVVEVSLSFERLEFSFTSKAVVRWVKEVVKNRRYEIGVKFVDISEIEARKLVNYIVSMKRLDNYV
ncbi:MAG: PilZ domain-containing protein [Candidatus Omnitrophica bacterium]|nr:PilZ domain-containing protein [Candidatus Omnitrophota bacterium]